MGKLQFWVCLFPYMEINTLITLVDIRAFVQWWPFAFVIGKHAPIPKWNKVANAKIYNWKRHKRVKCQFHVSKFVRAFEKVIRSRLQWTAAEKIQINGTTIFTRKALPCRKRKIDVKWKKYKKKISLNKYIDRKLSCNQMNVFLKWNSFKVCKNQNPFVENYDYLCSKLKQILFHIVN